MTTELTLTTERIDDFVLLINVLLQLDLPAILDRHIPRHWLQEGLSWGWVATIWLAHIISQGDHRKLTVRDWVRQAHDTLERATGQAIRDTDFTDDRLTIVLRELSKPVYWHAIEQDLAQHTIRVYDLEQKRVRVDATTVSGHHVGGVDSLFQFGKSKDNPSLLQVKVMQGVLDPMGLPIATWSKATKRRACGWPRWRGRRWNGRSAYSWSIRMSTPRLRCAAWINGWRPPQPN